ncbi:hypothetical protein KDK95_18175 [Actinospica sp. MGRD01-02]|uniref:Uncharacterized protein n=1 Tax=Actinospica acidithermotolerans TaxID=2828514 RepID=A0A941ED17_9ACTN|nr:hypothetical protein [Actinospica acidithermotolerans]MBR7828247.1 hypothetical protein [Actinospica acidithermotolerans]
MDTKTQVNGSAEQVRETGREAGRFRALMKRPATMVSTAVVVGAAVLGVVVLGDLARTETATPAVASSRSNGGSSESADRLPSGSAPSTLTTT